MARFVLIHGGLHGAWCWDHLCPALQARGHSPITMDLPVDVPGCGLDEYARAVLARTPLEECYLVAHSLGGFVAPRVARLRPKARIVMLCAGFPPMDAEQSRALAAAVDPDKFPGMDRDEHDRIMAPRSLALASFYGGVPPERALWAVERLRPQWIGAFTDLTPVEPYSDRVSEVIACVDDPIAPIEDQQRRARSLFALDPVLLPGGHSPFLACPEALADALDAVARKDRA